jgi:hypothetical protein
VLPAATISLPIAAVERWSLGSRSRQITLGVAWFAISAASLLPALRNPEWFWGWFAFGIGLIFAGWGRFFHPYEVEILPSGRLRFISVAKTVECDSSEVQRFVRQVYRGGGKLRLFTLVHQHGSITVHSDNELLYRRLATLPTLCPRVETKTEEYDPD